jgi:16S rRNA (cytosine1402-N4)-methyltransferase
MHGKRTLTKFPPNWRNSMRYHEPVMLIEALEGLKVRSGGKYIDATLGDGGHALGIMQKGGLVLGLDYDGSALQRASERIQEAGFAEKFIGVCTNFKKIDEVAEKNGFSKVDGIVFDLGYSSFQLDEGQKGLSFLKDEPLDMRLSKDLGVTAADLVNSLNEKDLAKLIFDLSDEKFAKRFAKAIVEYRNVKKISTTKELAEILSSVVPSGYEHGRINPATRTFQALRIAVNDELNNLEESLPRAARLLLPGGRMVAISFHSAEDRIVKLFGQGEQLNLRVFTKKPAEPSDSEITQNSRARSAKLRVFERI